MDEAQRTTPYKKDSQQERLLSDLNNDLVPVEEVLEQGFQSPSLPIVFVIGPPRGGTTLVSQCLAYCGAFGYVSNFVARFWQAPLVGARIERALSLRRSEEIVFASEHGVTQGWSSPHEFGYFWSSYFDKGQETHRLSPAELRSVDAAKLQRTVAALESFYGAPMMFKNNTWCTFHAHYLHRLFPKALFVVCRRDSRFVAQSILLARRARLGSEENWWSVRPSSYPDLVRLPWPEQIAGQVLGIEDDMDDSLAEVPPERVIELDYRAFCENPRALARELEARLGGDAFGLKFERPFPDRFAHTDNKRVSDADWASLAQAFKRLEGLSDLRNAIGTGKP